ncbi:AAA family ATPase [Blautia schinkii]|nr:AAA family ATPase [Blautia schinkii]
MNIKEAKTEIINTLRAYHRKDERGRYTYPILRQRPILLMGPPGIGKTAIMEQVARECKVGLVAYTITHHTRQSAIGLPRIVSRCYEGREVSVTEYTLSEIIASVYDCIEKSGNKEGILFIDEINCVSETLAPTMLQFLQNKTFGSHKVPEGWMIVAAGNPPEYNKSVREFDIVTLDRVRKIDIDVDCGVWMEYAWKNGVHGSILSYLQIKEENFYTAENTVDGKFFVTARGWEDLSEILKSYEAIGAAVSDKLVVQFLQKEEIAGDFAVYYQLYSKYGTDYGISELLAGELRDEAYDEKIAMAKSGSFEERFTVVGLLLDALNGCLAEYERVDARTVALHEALRHLKSYLKKQTDMQCFHEFIEARRKSLEVKRDAELISEEDAAVEEHVIGTLSGYDAVLRAEHIHQTEEGFGRVRELFREVVDERLSMVHRIHVQLERGFAFMTDSFGEEQEMVLFVTGLTRNARAMKFMGEHGCEAYFRCSESLLCRKQEQELRKACLDVLE